MYRFLVLFCLFGGPVFSETMPLVQITEIQPQKIGEAEEWFEFSVSGIEEINIKDWKISNGGTSVKKISDFSTQLILGENVLPTETPFLFKISGIGYFSWEKSPISLPNDGGTIQLLDETDKLLSEVTYSKLKVGETKDYKWSEIWNWDTKTQKPFSLIFRNNGDANFSHTKGQTNKNAPTSAETVKILISEVSPDYEKGHDFVEIYFLSGPEKINLKYSTVKLNGAEVWHFDSDFFVVPGEILTIFLGTDDFGIFSSAPPYEIHSHKAEGVSGGSGSVEILLNTETSHEQTVDVVCWKNEVLSETEKTKVEKFVSAQYWQGECVEIHGFVPNQSIARNISWTDSNTASDFFPHFNGSVGMFNDTKNQPPQAKITVQGDGDVRGTPPFSFNVTAEDSFDPDGNTDLEKFIWKLDGEVFSENENPQNIKIEALGTHKVELKVMDHLGAENTVFLEIFVVQNAGSVPSGESSAEFKAFLEKAIQESQFTKNKNSEKNEANDFFAPLLRDENFFETFSKEMGSIDIFVKKPEKTDPIPLNLEKNKRRIQIPEIVKKRAQKNLGVLFTWREVPWPALKAEWTLSEATYRTFEYFGATFYGS